MPEAPDLYVVREYLERRLTGQTVTKAEALRPIVLRCLAAPLERFAEDIAGRSLDGFWRRGKFLGIELSGGLGRRLSNARGEPDAQRRAAALRPDGAGVGAHVPRR